VGTAVRLSVDLSTVRLHRIACAFDCGAVVNPDGRESQVAVALVQGMCGALFEAVTFDGGRVTSGARDVLGVAVAEHHLLVDDEASGFCRLNCHGTSTANGVRGTGTSSGCIGGSAN
jgi:hypothetical protein